MIGLLKRNKRSIRKGLLGIIILALVIGGGYYFYTSTDKQDTKAASEVTADMKQTLSTLSNKEFPFTLKYPKGWTQKASIIPPSRYDVTVLSPDAKYAESNSPVITSGVGISIMKRENTPLKDIDDYKTQINATSKVATNLREIKVDGVRALQHEVNDQQQGPPLYTTVIFKDTSAYYITIQKNLYDKAEFGKSYQALVDSIVFN